MSDLTDAWRKAADVVEVLEDMGVEAGIGDVVLDEGTPKLTLTLATLPEDLDAPDYEIWREEARRLQDRVDELKNGCEESREEEALRLKRELERWPDGNEEGQKVGDQDE